MVAATQVQHAARPGRDRTAERPSGTPAALGHQEIQRPVTAYCALKLNLPRRTKRRLPTRLCQPLLAPNRLNEIWALDFMADALYGGRAFRTLNVIDEGNREVLGIEIATSIPARRVVRVIETADRDPRQAAGAAARQW
jgi:transposase InsO family protein